VGALPVKEQKEAAEFVNYKVQTEVPAIFEGLHSTIRRCTNTKFGSLVMSARVFRPSSLLKPDDWYLKLLRAIGRKNQFIIQTMDIFVDERAHIWLLQEFGTGGNAFDYSRHHSLTEGQMLNWAQAIYQAIDWLGDLGIAHRSIQPKHLLLKAVPGASDPSEAIRVKLSGFRDAIIYWDPVTKDIIDQPCLPAAALEYAFFQAPEVFNKANSVQEYFEPIAADLWSYGATMFYMVARMYPFNVHSPDPNVDGEIRNSIAACGTVQDAAKYWLYGLMCTFAKLRTEFDDIATDAWFRGNYYN